MINGTAHLSALVVVLGHQKGHGVIRVPPATQPNIPYNHRGVEFRVAVRLL